jgi:hypothetical protein
MHDGVRYARKVMAFMAFGVRKQFNGNISSCGCRKSALERAWTCTGRDNGRLSINTNVKAFHCWVMGRAEEGIIRYTRGESHGQLALLPVQNVGLANVERRKLRGDVR